MNYFKKIKWCLKPQVLHWLLCLSSDCDGGFPGGASGKEPACQFRRCKHTGSIPELVRTPGEGYSNPLQYSCLENPMDRGAWRAIAHTVTKNQAWLKWCSMHRSCLWCHLVSLPHLLMPRLCPRHHLPSFLWCHPHCLYTFNFSILILSLNFLFAWIPPHLSPLNLSKLNSVQSLSCVCDPMDCNMPGLPVHHRLPELAQTHVHQVGEAIQPSHPLSSPSPPAFNLSQHQCLFQWDRSSHLVAKVLEFQLQHQSIQWIFRTDFL